MVSPEKLCDIYQYTGTDTPENLQKKYLIRMNEEWSAAHIGDLRDYVIRAHNRDGDFEVYKYGLVPDKLTGKIAHPGGDYSYQGIYSHSGSIRSIQRCLRNVRTQPVITGAIRK